MKSHEYQFKRGEILRLLAIPLLVVGLFAATMKIGSVLQLLPAPWPIVDTDRTILLHQADASRQSHDAETLLIGDSSCLMDISAPELARELGEGPCLNLATLSYVDLDWHARFIRNYAVANPGKLKRVILLLHPESLRLGSRNPYFSEVLEHFLQGADYCTPADPDLFCWMGVPIFQGRIATRMFPTPLPGAYGQYYGFSWTLWDYLSAHAGSAIDPRVYRKEMASGSAEYRLSPQLEKSSRAFKSSLPPGTKLVIGLTPSPESFILPDHDRTCAAILQQWSEWLQADQVLRTTPHSLPDTYFASTTHLNGAGVALYTPELADAIQDRKP